MYDKWRHPLPFGGKGWRHILGSMWCIGVGQLPFSIPPAADSASNLPNSCLLGFSAALAPKFPPDCFCGKLSAQQEAGQGATKTRSGQEQARERPGSGQERPGAGHEVARRCEKLPRSGQERTSGQEQPGAARSGQERSGAARSGQKRPGAANVLCEELLTT